MLLQFFLAKNQLASAGPDIVQAVVIPALKPALDHSLTAVMTLCPITALRYYLVKTKDLRQEKHLLFISVKDDIQSATISSWLKQTVLLAYYSSDLEKFHVSVLPKYNI